MNKKEYYFDLPEDLIAQTPIKNRDMSRLLVLDKETGHINHEKFKDIVKYMEKGDTLVLNNTRVIPARIFGNREGKKEKIEFLLIKPIVDDKWEVMVRPGKKVKPGHEIFFGEDILKAKVLEITDSGTRVVEFSYQGVFLEILEQLGEMPLPPYIKEKLDDRERYQTVYSKYEGSAAAPTAGLHFTEELLDEIEKSGVNIVYITLHVGLGTFLPVKEEKIENHKMHEEFYIVSEEAADTINSTIDRGNSVICVGTTSARTLESAANKDGYVQAGSAWTDIFIFPGYKFKIVDKLITNFHLPESTLLMLVSALAGKDKIFKSYNEAIKNKYRFFSFGDSMFIK